MYLETCGQAGELTNVDKAYQRLKAEVERLLPALATMITTEPTRATRP